MQTKHGPSELVRRGVAVVGLLAVALIHLLDLESKFKETPYLGVAYVVLLAGCLYAAWDLTARGSHTAWVLAGMLALAALAGYMVSRSVGLPGAHGDVGNWLEPLGVAALFSEAVVLVLSVSPIRGHVEAASTSGKRSLIEAG